VAIAGVKSVVNFIYLGYHPLPGQWPEHSLDAEVSRVFYVPQALANRFAGAAVACNIVRE